MNLIHLAGRLGRDAEVRYTTQGDAVANFSLAVDERKKGEKVTLWVDCSLWGKLAESLAPYLLKGASVTVAGEASVRTFETRDNTTRAVLCCAVRHITLQGGREERSEHNDRPEPAQASQRRPAPRQQPIDPEPIDDDIPF